ncbi:MAG: hypothetical protein Q8L48_00290 [Archangium sp.]|nr:hypothetical protein [Archangium sp.]
MSSRLSAAALLSVATLALLACPGPQRPPPGVPEEPPDAGQQVPPDAGEPDAGHQPEALLRLGGPLELAPGVPVPSGLRAGLLWFPGLDPTAPASPRASVSGPVLGSPPAARWRLDVTAEPPAEARVDFQSPGGGAGQYSVGALVLFRDADGDGALTIGADGSTSDFLHGSAAGAVPFDLETPGVHTLVVWRSGNLGPDETGFVAGFNLVTIDRPFARPVAMPTTTDVTLRLSGDSRPGLMFCPPAYAAQTPELACGQRVYLAPHVAAVLFSMDAFGVAASVQVTAGQRAVTGARVLLNGVMLPADGQGGYALIELTPLAIQPGSNQLRVEATGFEPVSFEVVLPRAPTLEAPRAGAQLPAGRELTVTWMPAPGASSYDVSLVPDVGNGWFGTTTESQMVFTTPGDLGSASLSVSAQAMAPVGRHLSLGTSGVNVPVELVTP